MCENSKKKIKKNLGVGVGGSGWWGGGVRVYCEWRSEAIVKIQEKKIKKTFGGQVRGGGGGGWVWGGGGGGGQGGWEQRIEAFVKIQKNIIIFFFWGGGGRVGGGSGWGVRVDVNGEVKFL